MLAENSKSSVFKIMDELAAEVPAGSEGLLMLPFLTGAFFPEYNTDARGVFFGFGINHKKNHFVRAVLESLGYMMRNDIEAVEKLNIDIKKIISIGGGAASKLWSQIKADISNVEIEIPGYTETALLGSAMLAANAMGIFTFAFTLSSSVTRMRRNFLLFGLLILAVAFDGSPGFAFSNSCSASSIEIFPSFTISRINFFSSFIFNSLHS